MITDSIRWEVFTQQEKTNLKNASLKADYKIFTNLVDEMTPDKEAEILKLVNIYRGNDEHFESEVAKKMETEFLLQKK